MGYTGYDPPHGPSAHELTQEVARLKAQIQRLEFDLAQAEAAQWRIMPNCFTIPCPSLGGLQPDPFEGPGETYKAAYERLRKEATDD